MKTFFVWTLFSVIYQINAGSLQFSEVSNHLGTRTPYRFKSNKNDAVMKYHNCKPKKIWMMIRHGTRNPSLQDIVGMNSTLKDLKFKILLGHKLGKGNLTRSQLSSLQDWSSSLDNDKDKFLTHEGQEEMIKLAERMKKRFPDILKNKYDNKTYLFRYTATERTQQSARYFTKGLFGRKDAKDVIFSPATKVDTVLRFYKHCDKWQKQVKKNPDTYREVKAFEITQHMNDTMEYITKRLGLAKTISLGELKLMYKICGFEMAWNKHYMSPWCAAFDKKSAEVMEYYFDLKDYWVNGYGLELTYRQACMSIRNMFENFSQNKDPKAVFMFSHSGTILKLISHFGLYKPKNHLKASDFPNDRNWKTTDIDCFASNLAFVLFGCFDRDYVLAMHQEHIIKMPSCDSELCPLENLTRHFHNSIHNCDYDDMCRLNKKQEL